MSISACYIDRSDICSRSCFQLQILIFSGAVIVLNRITIIEQQQYKPRLKPKQNGLVMRGENIEQQQATKLR
jgi:hypothetical protein